MVGVERIDGGPRSVIVVGAGIVGLSTAWFLQERGVDVTVVDRTGVAAGASWGNAGWIAPGLTLSLNSPAVLRHALRSGWDPTAPLHIPLIADAGLRAFLIQFAANCRRSSWKRAMRANVRLNEECLEAFDVLDRQWGRCSGDRCTDHRGVSYHRRSGTHDDGATRARKGRPDNVCHRIVGRGVTRTSSPGLAGGHRRAEHQRAALRRPATIRGGPGPLRSGPRGIDPPAGNPRHTHLGQRRCGAPAQRKTADRRRRGDRHRRPVIAAGGPLSARAGAGRSRLLVYRARGAPDSRARFTCRTRGWRARPTRAQSVFRAPWNSATRITGSYQNGWRPSSPRPVPCWTGRAGPSAATRGLVPTRSPPMAAH